MSKKGGQLCLARFGTLLYSLSSIYSLTFPTVMPNDEGKALLKFKERVVRDPYGALRGWRDDDELVADPCSWLGVECSHEGSVVILDLRDLCLGGTLAPEIGNLVHMKAIILHNNSFTGIIPEEIGKLKELELLDLGNNNFTGTLPPDLGSHLSLTILWEKSMAKCFFCMERSMTWDSAASTQSTVQKPRLQMFGTNSLIMQLPTSTKSRVLRSQPAPPPPPCKDPRHSPSPGCA